MRTFTYFIFFSVLLPYYSFCLSEDNAARKSESKRYIMDWIKGLHESKTLNDHSDSHNGIPNNHAHQLQQPKRMMPFYTNMMKKIGYKNRNPPSFNDMLLLKTDACYSRYCAIARERLKLRRQERVDSERSIVASIAKKSLYSVFIGMHEKGQLPGASTSADPLKTSFYQEMRQGSAFIIANCHLSIAYAESHENNTVVILLLDEESAAKCQRIISKRKLTNIFSLVMDVKQMGEKLLSSELFPTFLTFDSLVIEEIGKITDGLLPHEVEQLMSKMLQVSHQTIISFDLQLEPEKLKYFKSAWHVPVDLINNICTRISNSSCSVKKIEGLLDSWKPSTFKIHLKKNASKEKISHFKDSGIPLQYLLSMNMTQASKDSLFLLLINSRINIGHQANFLLKGQQVLEFQGIKEVEAKEIPPTSSQHLDKPDKLAFISDHLPSFFKDHKMKNYILKTKVDEDFQKNGNHEIVFDAPFKDAYKYLFRKMSQPDSFEAQWNREESESFQKVLNDIENNKENAVSQAENGSFDIVDGRPIEEENKIAEAYRFLKSNSFRHESITEGLLFETVTPDSKIHESHNDGDSRVILKTSKTENPYPYLTKTNFPVKQGNEEEQRRNGNQNSLSSNYSESGKKKVFKLKQQKKTGISQLNITDLKTSGKSESGKKKVFKLKQQKKTGISQLNITDLKTSGKSSKWVINDENPKMRNNLDRATETRREGRKLLMMPPSMTQLPAKLALGKIPFASLNNTEREKALNHLLQVYDKSNGFTSSAATASQTPYTLKPHQQPMNIKVLQGASIEDVYHCMKNIILTNLKTFLRPNQIPSALISGDCAFSMLSAKLSMLYPRISLITLKSTRTPKCHDDIRSLLKNNFHFNESLNPDIVYQISHTPQLFDFQIISSHIFSWLLQMGEDFKHYMADILSQSKVSFIEVANWTHLVSSSKLFGHSSYIWKNVEEFLNEQFTVESSWIRYLKIEDISTSSWKSLRGSSIYRIELSSIQRKVQTSCRSQPQMLSKFHYEKTKSIRHQNNDKAFPFQQNGLNLKMLLTFELDSVFRRKMFVNYIKLNKHKDMCPSNLYWSQGKLWHQDDDISVQYQRLSIKELTHILNQDIHQNSFSFMDYNSPNRHIGTNLAQLHPNSTFILAHPSSSEAAEKLKEIKSQNLENTIPLDLPMSDSFTKHFVKSPDILRYQYFDFVSLLHDTYGKDEIKVNAILGGMLATGLTTFITVPSAEILSLAATTLYPAIFTENDTVSDSAPFFENAEQKLLMQSIRAGFKIKLHTTFHPSTDLGQDVWFPWRLVSLRIMKLQLWIDHHFMFELDGHRRKYIQHVERKDISSPPVVYLLREEDSYKINYGDVNALLRMGLLSSMKEEFYNKFLQLPLYEDMAPWNIVFRAGALDYIDQDTRDTTLEKFVPMAYQVMSGLMNYQRTVQDFGHCKGTARTAYNVHYIASCVESDFQGPCPDSRYPVPCGDKSCESSYIECLRAMNKRMTDLNDSYGRGEGNNSSHKKKPAFTNIWSFDGKGKTQIE